jgi:hypothetical protein
MIEMKETSKAMMPVEMLLKNGRKKHGILLDTVSDLITTCQFVCNSRIKDFEETKDLSLIEIIPFNTVASIDTYIR